MAWDAHKNLAASRVASPPSPAASGTSLDVDSGDGALFPAAPFNCTVWPQGQNPTADNAEIIRVTVVVGDTFTFSRAQEGTAAIAIGNNFQIANTITTKVIEDIETAISNIISAGGGGVSVISAELASVDARVTSVEAHVDVLSASVAVVSAAIASVDARATSLESRISTNSAAVSVLSDRVTSLAQVHSVLCERVSALSAQVSVISIIAAAGGGITTAEVSAIVDLASNVASAGNASIDARVSLLSLDHTSTETHVNTVSAAVAAADNRVSVLSGLLSLTNSAHLSTDNRVSVLSGLLSLANSAHLSTDQRVSLLSAQLSLTNSAVGSVDARITSVVANQLSALSSQVSVVSIIAAAGGGVPVNMLSLTNGEAAAVSAGCPVYATASANTFRKADASATGTELVLGLVADVTIAVSAVGRVQTAGKLSLTSAQWSDVTSVGTGLTPGDIYYLNISAGRLTTVEPTGTAVVHVVGQALSPNEMQLMLTPFDDQTSAFSALSAQITSINAMVASLSVRTTAAVSIKGLQSIFNALSNRISAGGGTGSATSQEVSVGLAAVSAQAASALADAISAGSATASNLLSNINVISNYLSNVSARTNLSATTSVKGLQSAVNGLSNRISINAKAISDIISAGGGGVSVTSAELSASVQVASAAATSVDARIASLSVVFASLSVLSNGAVSTHGLQSILNALSSRISAAGGTASATSQEISVLVQVASAAATSVNARVTSLEAALNSISAISATGTGSVNGLQSVVNVLSGQFTSVNAAIASVDAKASIISDRVTSISAQIVSVDSRIASLSVVFASLSVLNTAAVSVHGLQSIMNALSNRISAGGGGGATTAFVSALVDTASNTASAGNISLDNRIASISAVFASVSVRNSAGTSIHGLQSIINVLSNQDSVIVSAIAALDGRVATTSAVVASVSAVSGATSVKGIQSVINQLSQRISSLTGGGLTTAYISSFSVMSGVSATVSTHGLQSILNALSNRISINHAFISDAISVGSATASALSNRVDSANTAHNTLSLQVASLAGRIALLAADANVSAGTLTTIPGLSLALSIGGIYEMHAMVLFTLSAAQPFGFGLNFGGMAHAAGNMYYHKIGQDANQSTVSGIQAAFDETATGSIILSSYASVGTVGGTGNVEYNGVFVVSTSAPTPMHLMAKASTGDGGQIVLKKGSYLRLLKLG